MKCALERADPNFFSKSGLSLAVKQNKPFKNHCR